MLAAIITVVLLPLFSWLIYWYYRVNYFEKYLKNVPGTIGVPLVGHIFEVNSPIKIIDFIMRHYRLHNTNFKIYLGTQAYLNITEPEDIEFFLSSPVILKKSDLYTYMQPWLGEGLLTSSGNKWKKHRKILTPAFHFKILEKFIEVFNTQSNIFASKLELESEKGDVDIFPFVVRYTLDVICEAAMGTYINAQDDHNSKYVKSVHSLLDIFAQRIFSPILSASLLYPFSRTYWREKFALNTVHTYTKSVITKRKKTFLRNIVKDEDTINHWKNEDKTKKKAFLDLLLDYWRTDASLTEGQIREEVDTFMFEGHDTTASAISFTLYCISRHPEIQRKAYEELKAIYCDDLKRNTTYKDLQEMKYLEMIIKESMRMYTTVPLVGRMLEEDVEWRGITLPKGLMINVWLYCVHNSINSGKNFDKFDPERFNVEHSKYKHPFSFVPFSAGPRNCIGQKFAMLEMKCTLSTILRRFELSSSISEQNIVLKAAAVLKPNDGIYIQLKRR